MDREGLDGAGDVALLVEEALLDLIPKPMARTFVEDVQVDYEERTKARL
jgi:hypothetical protein